ncbi:pyruvate kinase [Corynebacterium epidermidicanis]|uniref:pyruvate kinase n=1 Tax=Corynebacterium epidermidicanis TaxID=1050174 RepID=A0A0G3GSQ5_9CORY|nr:pyruvate kinase [Corynebacterium epidermidicanis]AKK04186.1 pyruvate kinase [Corynebacterium epidermidicanis]
MSNYEHLVDDIDRLLTDIAHISQSEQDRINKVAPTHFAGAHNLLHYAHLRSVDLRPLQAGLTSIGATRLSTVELGVKPKLEAARNIVGLLSGRGAPYNTEDIANAFANADEVLEEHTTTLLGEAAPDTHSRIMVTLPSEAADDYEMVKSFVDAGMELARINCAHDGAQAWAKMIDHVHRAAAEAGREVRINMDLAGPKIRTGAIADGPQIGRARVLREESGTVLESSKLWITSTDNENPPLAPAFSGRPALALQVDPEWYSLLEVDSIISLHDTRGSKRAFEVTQVLEGAVLAEGDRNAYIAEGTLLECDYQKTRATGIPPIVRRIKLKAGDRLVLTTAEVAADATPGVIPVLSCTLPEAVRALEVGQHVLFDDGSIAAIVREKRTADFETADHGHTEAVLEVTQAKIGGTNLAANKGINLPETDLPLASLTPEDEVNLEFVARHADIAAISFVRTPEDVRHVIEVLDRIAEQNPDIAERVRNLGLVLKIETVPGFNNLAGIILEGMRHANLGLMIARGDLAVELGFERMAEVPQQILTLAEAAHIPVIVGTQILENLAKNGLPSRAEITDAAFALRSECVMLNKGPHINDAIRVLDKMSRKLGRSQRKNRMLLRHIHSWDS